MVYVLFAIFNRKELTISCLKALSAQSFSDFKVIIFDDASTDGSSEAIQQLYPSVKILRGAGNFWWSKSMNEGLRYIKSVARPGDHVLTLNNDTDFSPTFIEQLVQSSDRYGRAIMGALVRNFFDSSIVEDCGTQVLWNPYRIVQIPFDSRAEIVGPLDALACRGTLIPIEVFDKIGDFDERWMPHYLADIDFFARAKKSGFRLFMNYHSIIFEKEQPGIKSQKFSDTIWGRFQKLWSIRSNSNWLAHSCFILRHAPNCFFGIRDWGRMSAAALIRTLFPR